MNAKYKSSPKNLILKRKLCLSSLAKQDLIHLKSLSKFKLKSEEKFKERNFNKQKSKQSKFKVLSEVIFKDVSTAT